jgi:hypothetical protein
MSQPNDPFLAARSALKCSVLAPPIEVELHGPNAIDLPDDFLCELARFLTRFVRLRASLSTLLQAPVASEQAELTDAQARKLTSILARTPQGGFDQPIAADDYMRRFWQLALIADRLYEHEWRATSERTVGARLENWPPGSSLPSAANDTSLPAVRIGDRISKQEIENLSRHCAALYMAIVV